jgi:hypothetical protein
VKVSRFIEVLEGVLGREAETRILPMQPGDVGATRADTDALRRDTGFAPNPDGLTNKSLCSPTAMRKCRCRCG